MSKVTKDTKFCSGFKLQLQIIFSNLKEQNKDAHHDFLEPEVMLHVLFSLANIPTSKENQFTAI